MRTRAGENGFTLIEVSIAVAIVGIVMGIFLALRTTALIDATEGRNWRLARELAEQMLSELRAGARELPPTSGQITPFKDYPDFSYQFLIGETAISNHESSLATDRDVSTGSSESDRLAWQRNRDQSRVAGQKGLSLDQNQQNQQKQTEEEKLPSEDEIEEVAIIIYFPIVRTEQMEEKSEDTFTLKAKICTMAIQGLTPDKADAYAKSKGKDSSTPTTPGSAGSGTPTK